jgi:hypothetical protein
MPGPPDHPYPKWLSYLTNWSITLLGVAGALGAVNSLRCSRARARARARPVQGRPLRPRWDALSIAHQLVAELAVSAALFVSIFFWAGVVGLTGGGAGDATSYVAHAGNAGVALLLLLLSRLPVASSHFLVLLCYASLYEVFAFIYGSTTGDWRYGLDWTRAGSAVAYALVPIFCFAVFVLAFVIASAREGAGRRGWCWCGRGRGAARPATAAAPAGGFEAGGAPGGGGVV